MSIRQSGEIIPDMVRFGAFPFEATEYLGALVNITGGYGLTNSIEDNVYHGFSGIAGPGTFYPISGSLDTFLRMFWGVKTWKLQISVSIFGSNAAVSFPSTPGLPNECDSESNIPYEVEDIIVRTLTTQDLFSNSIDIGQYSIKPDSDSSFSSTQTCVPIDPIQKWSDLLCRKDYFTWTPPDSVIQSFFSGTAKLALTGDLKSPYVSKTSPFFPGYDNHNGRCSLLAPDCLSYFSLSLMNPDFLCQPALIRPLDSTDPREDKYVPFISGKEQSINPDKDNYNNYFGSIWESGSPLTDKWGQITGYAGLNKPPTDIPNIFFKNYYTSEEAQNLTINDYYNPDFNPPWYSGYFPLFNFSYFLRNASNSLGSTINTIIRTNLNVSSRLPYKGARHVGDFRILDSSIITNDNSDTYSFGDNRTVATIPLFGESSATNYTISVSLTPASSWISKNNLDLDILN